VSGCALPDVCDGVLVGADELKARVEALGAVLASDLADERDVCFVTVLKGGLFFLADLCRATNLPMSLDFMAVSPYVAGEGGRVRLTKDLADDIDGACVVLVEDIVDTGLTVNYIMNLLRAHNPERLLVCALLDKPARRIAEVPIDYLGFEIPDRFAVGYGLDLAGRYRNLSCVASVRDEVMFA
jgi:hypoxanthine phosphoribosyltransferase